MEGKAAHIDGIRREIDRLCRELIRRQGSDGRWSFCFESGPMTDAYMILLYRLFGWKREERVAQLARRLQRIGEKDGVWKLYPDEPEGNISATVEAAVGLMYAGVFQPDDPRVRQAREFVLSQGGLEKSGSLTKVMLTLIGLYDWSRHPRVPAELLLLPRWFPINFFDFVGFTRVHVAPILLASNRRFSCRLSGPKPDLDTWSLNKPTPADISSQTVRLHEEVEVLLRARKERRGWLHQVAMSKGERFILERIEPDGTLYSYFSSTFLMIFGLMAMGYPKNHPVLQRAMNGLEQLAFSVGEEVHVQETSSTVWDTALITFALQRGGVPPGHPAIRRAAGYLFSRQHIRYGDWALRNPGVFPGGWGFFDINTINPDLDDTSAALRAVAPTVLLNPAAYAGNWNRGVNWLLSMQNRDGGWSAFEKNTDKSWPRRLLPFEDAHTVWTDPSINDLTGRTLEFLGNHLGWRAVHPAVQRAVRFLRAHQEKDGSWFGRWGVAYIYGTWAALTGMASVGYGLQDPAVSKGVRWLESIQNKDGGWGESCRSDVVRRYVPLGGSTPSQTAWALDALIAVYDRPTPAIEAGIGCLLDMGQKEGGWMTYPTGAGLSGGFYIHYHSYRYIWPLLALAHYRDKYG
ncbi:sporulenol synthase [Marinithermofilum abyssi]|uniref:Sporulenol synthase n=1 Tax=Marinithermofilum abyssi TaxID=1571185 RepID=A0A8J2VC12_9BACL|nr:squalene--hopene cyclase [Marinithermofilum abyssi]GGE18508.1 sporulenol synthase [Marinithermofilum abyssi]